MNRSMTRPLILFGSFRGKANREATFYTRALKTIGADLRTARLRRNLSQEDVARKLGVSRQLIAEAEKGKATTSAAVYAGLFWVLGLLSNLSDAANPAKDEEGTALERAHGRKHARTPAAVDNDF